MKNISRKELELYLLNRLRESRKFALAKDKKENDFRLGQFAECLQICIDLETDFANVLAE